MNKIKYITAVLIAFLFAAGIYTETTYAKPRQGYNIVYGKITRDNLTITSYSSNWTNANLHTIYDELMENTISKELGYLSNIYIYPDSPYNIQGNYFEDIKASQSGDFIFGSEAYIELYDGLRYHNASEIAPILSHEYGHHYTIFNIMNYDNKLYTQWEDTEYARIRDFDSYPVVYTSDSMVVGYHYLWDVAEIAANDYVQLLGSDNAKASYTYLDNKQIVESRQTDKKAVPIQYNAKPQDNQSLPLAADTAGLHEYLLKIGGKAGAGPSVAKRAAITSITEEEALISKTYELQFEKAEGKGLFEYTVVMISENKDSAPLVLKTLNDGDELKVTFGTFAEVEGDRYIGVLEQYTGKHEIRIYSKDSNGFIYTSDAFYYDFGA